MKNIEEQQEIKQSLDEDVFSQYHFKSQKDRIIEKATAFSDIPKRKNYYLYGLSGVAVLLFSIVALSYFFSTDTSYDPASPDKHDEQTETENPVVNHNEYLAEPDLPLSPHKPVDSIPDEEKGEPAQVQKTEEEWKAYFQNLYQEQQTDIKRMKLIYEYVDSGSKAILEITSKFEGNHFIERENQKDFENEVMTMDHSYIATDEEYIFLDHLRKIYDRQSIPETEVEYKKHKTLYGGSPLYHIHEMVFEGYQWTEVEQNIEENWVTFELVKTNPQVFLFERSLIKIEYDSGVVLERKEYNGEEFVSYFKLIELKLNDELPDLLIEKYIPEDYADLQVVKSQQERPQLHEDLFIQAKDNVMKNNEKIQDVNYTGEDGSLHFILYMTVGTTPTEGQEAGQELFEQFTEITKSYEPLQERNTTIWAEGQFTFSIRVEIPETAFLFGEFKDPQIHWEQKPYGGY
jgi:hypothetical protein